MLHIRSHAHINTTCDIVATVPFASLLPSGARPPCTRSSDNNAVYSLPYALANNTADANNTAPHHDHHEHHHNSMPSAGSSPSAPTPSAYSLLLKGSRYNHAYSKAYSFTYKVAVVGVRHVGGSSGGAARLSEVWAVAVDTFARMAISNGCVVVHTPTIHDEHEQVIYTHKLQQYREARDEAPIQGVYIASAPAAGSVAAVLPHALTFTIGLITCTDTATSDELAAEWFGAITAWHTSGRKGTASSGNDNTTNQTAPSSQQTPQKVIPSQVYPQFCAAVDGSMGDDEVGDAGVSNGITRSATREDSEGSGGGRGDAPCRHTTTTIPRPPTPIFFGCIGEDSNNNSNTPAGGAGGRQNSRPNTPFTPPEHGNPLMMIAPQHNTTAVSDDAMVVVSPPSTVHGSSSVSLCPGDAEESPSCGGRFVTPNAKKQLNRAATSTATGASCGDGERCFSGASVRAQCHASDDENDHEGDDGQHVPRGAHSPSPSRPAMMKHSYSIAKQLEWEGSPLKFAGEKQKPSSAANNTTPAAELEQVLSLRHHQSLPFCTAFLPPPPPTSTAATDKAQQRYNRSGHPTKAAIYAEKESLKLKLFWEPRGDRVTVTKPMAPIHAFVTGGGKQQQHQRGGGGGGGRLSSLPMGSEGNSTSTPSSTTTIAYNDALATHLYKPPQLKIVRPCTSNFVQHVTLLSSGSVVAPNTTTKTTTSAAANTIGSTNGLSNSCVGDTRLKTRMMIHNNALTIAGRHEPTIAHTQERATIIPQKVVSGSHADVLAVGVSGAHADPYTSPLAASSHTASMGGCAPATRSSTPSWRPPNNKLSHYVATNIGVATEGEHVICGVCEPTEAHKPFLPCLTSMLPAFLVVSEAEGDY